MKHLILKRRNRTLRSFAIVFIAIFIFCIICFPTVALAWPWDDVLESIDNWFKGLLAGCVNGLLTGCFSMVKEMGASSPLTADWNNLLAGNASGGSTLLQYASDISNGIVKPIGCGVLTFVVLIQLIKISGRMDSNGTLPAIKEILTLFVTIAIFIWLINHIDELCAGIYQLVNGISKAFLKYSSGGTDAELKIITPESYSDVSYADLFAAILMSIFAYVIAMGAYVVALALSYARAIQLYVMAAFSPLPASFLGIDETRQWGVNFFKNFVAVALAGSIMLFTLLAFPFILGAIVGTQSTEFTWSNTSGFLITVLKMLSVDVVLLIGLIKSGAWAKDILGG